MEQIIGVVIEKSVVAAGFIYLLWYFVTRFNATLQNICDVMCKISETLIKMDLRFDLIEERLKNLEEIQRMVIANGLQKGNHNTDSDGAGVGFAECI